MIAAGRHLLGDAEPGEQRIRVIRAQRPLAGLKHIPELVLGPGMIAAGRHILGDAEPGGQRIRVIRASLRSRWGSTSRNSSSAPALSPRAAISRAMLNRTISVSG